MISSTARLGSPASVRLRLLGPPQVEAAGDDRTDPNARSVALPPERGPQLVVWLALKRTWVGRPEVAALLWPELDSKLAFANLRKALHRLHTLPWAGGLETQGQALRFSARSDVADFETALAEDRVDDALALYRGDLLAGFDDGSNAAWTDWLNFERDRLRSAWRSAALARLAAGDMASQAQVELTARLAAADPLDEAALAAQMRALAASGHLGAARAAYRGYRERLRSELGIAPGAALDALHNGLGGGADHALSATASGADPPRAAVGDEGFFGRSSELDRIAGLLTQDECAMLSLTGPGGVGKTRLARRAMHELAGRFGAGAVFVPLEDVADAAQAVQRLASELGLPLRGARASAQPDERFIEQIAEHLCRRPPLLVLDNFEHLAADAGWLDLLHRRCPRLKVLLTSRVRPVAQAVWSLPLEGLPCPEAEDVGELEAFDAARVFIRAAQRVEPALPVAAEAAAIADICRQVGGSPLALELAASWTRVLSCAAIADELRAGTELLRSADATDPARPARHASMEAIFEQSWRHLVAAERDALSRLAVFRGGFTAAAARAVAGASLPILGALADKSLLRKEGERCQLHPLVQQFALARLDGAGTRTAAERAHAEFFQRLVDQLRGAIGLGQREALRQLEVEFDNCRAAWQRAVALGLHRALAAYAPALRDFCDHKGRYAEGLALLDAAIAQRPADAGPLYEPLLASAAAHLEYRLDRYPQASEAAARALAAVPSDATTPTALETRLQCLRTLGVCALAQGRHADAQRYLRQVLGLAEAAGDARVAAGTLDNLSLIEKAAGRFDEARRMGADALQRYRRLEHANGIALCLNNLGSLELILDELDAAAAHLHEGLELCAHHGLAGTRCFVLANLAEVALARGRIDEAHVFATRGLDATAAVGHRAVEGWLHHLLARVALGRGRLDEARASMARGFAAALEVHHHTLMLDGLCVFAELLHAAGQARAAARTVAFAAGQPAAPARLRAWGERKLDAWGGAQAPAMPSWPWRGVDELVQRVVQETSAGYAPLIDDLNR